MNWYKKEADADGSAVGTWLPKEAYTTNKGIVR
jgi:hypothetical protein